MDKQKVTEELGQCSTRIPNDQWMLHYHQCPRKAIVLRNGKPYCKVHDPEYIKQKDIEQNKKWEHDSHVRVAEAVAGKQCLAINPSHPEYVAEKIGEMYKALQELLSDLRQHAIPNDLSEYEAVLNAINSK